MAVCWYRPRPPLPRKHAPEYKKIVTLTESSIGEHSTAKGRLSQPVLFLACCSEDQFRRQIEFLRAEDQMFCQRVLKRRIGSGNTNESQLDFAVATPL